jgi:hypothetical protein
MAQAVDKISDEGGTFIDGKLQERNHDPTVGNAPGNIVRNENSLTRVCVLRTWVAHWSWPCRAMMGLAVNLGGPGEAHMASKDKGVKSSKTAAAKTQKEKRAAKREKKQTRGKLDRST